MSAQTTRIRALLVDDHPVVRAGYKLLLEHAGEIEVFAEADSGELACRRYADHRPDVVIMDLSLRGMGGLEAIGRIVARHPGARILVFSMHEDAMFAERAVDAGARGYITKRSAPHVLVNAVKEVAAGGVYLDHEIAQRLAFQKAGGRTEPLKALTTREFEIFCLVAGGATAIEIGRRLSLSSKTVANYTTQIKSKLDVATIAELARLAIRHGIVDA